MPLAEKAATALLQGMSEDVKKEVTDLQAKGYVTINPENIPAAMSYDPQGVGLENSLKGLLSGTTVPALKNMSQAQLSRELQPLLVRDTPQGLGKTKILAPTQFGGKDLAAADLAAWRAFKKDSKDEAKMLQCLRFVVRYHTSHNNKFSEKTLVEHLYIVVPTKAINAVLEIASQGMSLQYLYNYCMLTYGQILSDEQIRTKVDDLLTNATDPIVALNMVLPLMQTCSGSPEATDLSCLAEARRFIRTRGGSEMVALIDAMFLHETDKSFITYLQVINDSFQETIRAASKKHKVHNVMAPEEVNQTDRLVQQELRLREMTQPYNAMCTQMMAMMAELDALQNK